MSYINSLTKKLKDRNSCCNNKLKSFFQISVFTLLAISSIGLQPCFSEELSHSAILKKLDTKVMQSDNNKGAYFPAYHFTAKASELNDIAALCYFNGKYHIFFQQSLNTENKQYKYIGHALSDDLIQWKYINSSLLPFEYYDIGGVSGGSAFAAEDLLYIFYTGRGYESRPEQKSFSELYQPPYKSLDKSETDKFISTQNLATSKDGYYFGRSANNPVIKAVTLNEKHEFSKDNFAHPYIWKHEDYYYALVGTQYKKTKDGAVLLYKSQDLRNWQVVNISAIGQNGEAGYMWDSPAMFNTNGFDVLTISPKGLKPHGKLFLNKHQTGAFVGKLDYKTGKFAQTGAFMLYDYGFDFFAPKFTQTPDGRVICIGFMGMEGTDTLEKASGWQGLATIPREVKVVNGKLHTVPAKELEELRQSKVSVHPLSFSGEKEFLNIKGAVYELDADFDLTDAKKLTIKLRHDVSNELTLSYDKDTQVLKLDRTKAGGKLSGQREVVLPLYENKLHLRIYSDKSSVEIFANNGPVAMSTRMYPEKAAAGIKFESEGTTKIEKLDLYKLKTIE